MSWSITASSTSKQEVKDKVNAEQYCPDVVKETIAKLVDACPEGKTISLSTYGHHNNGELANVGITISNG